MDVLKALQLYVDRMVDPAVATGMKVMVLDEDTKRIVGMAYSMTNILDKEVYLIETLGAQHESMHHMKAVCFLRPTPQNVDALRSELAEPKYSEYYLFFSNVISQDLLRTIADADTHAVIKSVQEFFGDYYPINSDLVSLNISGGLALSLPRTSWTRPDIMNYERTIQGIMSVLLAVKLRPYVRCSNASTIAQAVGREVSGRINGSEGADLFSFGGRRDGACVLLVLDRRDDPVTPLLTQWTYQAMVHELLGIEYNRVHTKGADVPKDMEDLVLSADQDPFFKANMLSNYGDLGVNVQGLLETYQSERKVHERVSSIADMQRFVENYPELRRKGHSVGKHVTIMSQLVKQVDTRCLMDVSRLEQDIACSSQQSHHLSEIMQQLENPQVTALDGLRLVLLYALRYERDRGNRLDQLVEALRTKGLADSDLALLQSMLHYAGADKRFGDLFGNSSFLSKFTSSVSRGISGVDNVFTQHKPLLSNILTDLQTNKLSRRDYPYFGSEPSSRITSVVIFIAGGATFEEAALVQSLNGRDGWPRLILVGTNILNSKSFLDELRRLGTPAAGGAMDHK